MVPPMEQMFPTAEEGEEVQRKTTLLNYRIWGEFIWIFFFQRHVSQNVHIFFHGSVLTLKHAIHIRAIRYFLYE